MTSAPLLGYSRYSSADDYIAVASVPVFDVHKHKSKGDVDEAMLSLLCENTNERCQRGDFPLLSLGHTSDDGPEDAQPEPVGYADSFAIAPFRGRPCIFCTFHIRRDCYERAATFPYRSIERLASAEPEWNIVERIALLRRQPERDLGVLTLPPPSPRGGMTPREEQTRGTPAPARA